MNITYALSEFLQNKEYFISLFEDKVHIYRYKDLSLLTSNKIILQMEGFNFIIKGEDLIILQMNKEELLISGKIKEVLKDYE